MPIKNLIKMEIRYYRKDKTHWGYDVEKTGLYCKNCNNAFTMSSRGVDEKLEWAGK